MDRRKATLVGIVSFIMLVLISAMIIWKSDIRFRANGYKLICSFANVGGLLKGSEVRYRGYSVGRVSQITPSPGDIQVEIWIKRNVPVTKGSTVRVLFDGLVGENYVGIDPNLNEKELVTHGDVLYGSSGSDLAEFIDLGSQNMVHAEAILFALRKVITNKDTLDNVQNIIKDLDGLTGELFITFKELNKHADFSKVSVILDDLGVVSKLAKVNSERLLSDGTVVTNLKEMLVQLVDMTQNLNSTSIEVKDSIDPETVRQFKETIQNLNQITNTLNGFLGSATDEKEPRKLKLGGLFDLLTSVDFDTKADFRYGSAEEKAIYDASVDVNSGKYFIRTGIGDRSGENKLQTIQHGIHYSDKVTSRVGYMYETPGIGVDYEISPLAGVTIEAYDFGQTKVDILGSYQVKENVDLLYGLRTNQTDDHVNTVDLGTRVKF